MQVHKEFDKELIYTVSNVCISRMPLYVKEIMIIVKVYYICSIIDKLIYSIVMHA